MNLCISGINLPSFFFLIVQTLLRALLRLALINFLNYDKIRSLYHVRKQG